MELTDNDLIFFSSGAAERNEDIIPKMLERVLECDPTEYIRENVKIFSRHDTIDTNTIAYEERKKYQPVGMYGQNKKDLTVVVTSEELKYTLLIDDDPSYIISGQEKNLLKVNGRSAANDLYDVIKLSLYQKLSPKMTHLHDSFYSINKLFYATGVLKDLRDTYSRVDRDLIDIMWDAHGFKYDKKGECYKMLKRIELYQSGLEVLQGINSEAGFLVETSNI